MTKKELIMNVSDTCELPQADVKRVIEEAINQIHLEMLDGGKVSINNFGVFQAKETPSRKVRNFKTKSLMIMEERCIPTFKASKSYVHMFNDMQKGKCAPNLIF